MKARRPYARTGLNALKARVKVRGLHAIDRRTAAARGLLQWRQDLVTDLAGEDTLSVQKKSIIEQATRYRLYGEHLDAFLMEQRSLVNRRRQAVLPVLRERLQIGDALLRCLAALGLERREKDVLPNLDQIRREFVKVSNGDGQDNGR